MNDFALFIADLSIISVLLPLGIAVIQWKKLTKEFFIFKWILIASVVCEMLMHVTALTYGNSYLIVNIFLLLNFLLFLGIFRISHANKNIAVGLGVAYLIFFVLDIIYFERLDTLATNAIVVSSLIIIVLSLNYFYKILNELNVTHIHRLPMLWLTFGVLLYYSCTLFVMLANNYLLNNDTDSQRALWIVHNFFNIIENIFFSIALWKHYRAVKSSI